MSKSKKLTFQDGDGPFLTIKSEWQSKITTSSSSCQTEEVKYEDSQFQTGLIIPNARVRTIKIKQLVKAKKGSKKTEGKEEPPKMISKKLTIPSLDSVKNGLTPSDDDIYNSLPIEDDTQTEEITLEYASDAFDLDWKLDEKTSAFFIRASKLILNELDVSKTMDVFQNQASSALDNLDGPVIKEKIDYTYLSRESMENEEKIRLQCIDVQYNCNNNYLWAAYGMNNHLSWCEHQGGIVCWKVKDLKQPFTIIECDTCVTCIKCHPQNPSIIAAGTFDGKVHIWNISYTEQPNIGNTPVGDPFHKEPIIAIDWIYDSSTIYHILSGSTDGLVLCWNLRDDVKYPFLGFYIPVSKDLKEPAALTSVACTHEGMMTTSFIATSNGGVIYQGRLRDDKIPPVTKYDWDKRALDLIKRCQATQKVVAHIESYAQRNKLKEIKLEHLFKCKLSPYVLYAKTSVLNVEPHYSPLFSLKTSPLISNLVCCTMMDGCIEVFNYLYSKKLVDLYPPFQVFKCVNFSPHKSSVFAAGSTDGTVLIYDLISSKNGPKFTVSCSSSFAVNNISFSGKDLNQLAAASGDGMVYVFNLPSYLKEMKNDELIEMKKLAQGKGDL